MLGKFRWALAVIFLVLISTGFFTSFAQADINSCYAAVTPNQVGPNSNITFQIAVHNTDPVNAISWIKISRPSGNFVINTATISGWGDSTNANDTTQTGGTLSPDGNLTAYIYTAVADTEPSAANWGVQVSDNVEGTSPFNCNGGDLSTAIVASDNTLPIISNITVSNLNTTTATINWNTDEPSSSQVNYGQTDGYGSSTGTDSNLMTSHSLNLSGLTANTGYHYQAVSTDASSNTATSSDNTFLTSTAPLVIPPTTPIVVVPPSTPTAQVPINTNAPVKTEIPLKATPTEKVPPIISFSTNLDGPFKEAPTITGQASDNEALAGIEYSTDGGQNWLPVDKTTGVGGKTATFSFTPQNLDDGNYSVLARAIDTSANIGKTAAAVLIIDRLPPIVGGSLLSVGPQVLSPDSAETITALVGIDQKITLSATGGPISINLLAKRSGSPTSTSIFTLTKSADTGLWSGVLGFSKPGDYALEADALDGAGNKTQRVLATVSVVAAPQLLASSSSSGQNAPISDARLSVYYLAPETNSWVVWDGAPFSQNNPQKTKADGSFRYLLPAGTYYLKAEAKGYRTLATKRFSLDRPQPLTSSLHLKKTFGFKIGSRNFNLPLLWPSLVEAPTPQGGTSRTPTASKLVGTILPQFTLPGASGGQLNSIELLGKPTVLSLMATWSPPSQEQLAAIAQLQANPDINVVPVAIQQSPQAVAVYIKTAGYSLNVFVDADGVLVDKLALYSLPTHYFIDRKGAVKKVMVGVLSKEQLLEQIASP